LPHRCSVARAYAYANDAAALALVHGVWVGRSFLPDTPCAREFSRNGL